MNRRFWIAIATWSVVVGVFFWVSPPPDKATGAVTALLGLVVLPLAKGSGAQRAWLPGTVLLALSAGVFFTFEGLRDGWTVRRGDRIYFVGGVLTDSARRFLEAHPEADTVELLENAQWNPNYVWTAESLRRNRLVLSALYVVCVPLFCVSLASLALLGLRVFGGTWAPPAPLTRAREASVGPIARPEGALVFFSYCRKDAPFCLRLAHDLKSAGVEAWIDQLDIPPGAAWDIEVEGALKRAAAVVLVLSPDAVASRNVLDEVSVAIDGGQLVVPILHRHCEVPLRLRRIQFVDFTRDYDAALDQLLLRLTAS